MNAHKYFFCSIIITLYQVSIEIYHVISELCYKGTIFQRQFRKMTISCSFSYVKFDGKKMGAFGTHGVLSKIAIIMRCVLKELHCIT